MSEINRRTINFDQSKIDELVSDLDYFHFNRRQFEIFLFTVNFYKQKMQINDIAIRVIILDSLIELQKEIGDHTILGQSHPSFRFRLFEKLLIVITNKFSNLLVRKDDVAKLNTLKDELNEIYMNKYGLQEFAD